MSSGRRRTKDNKDVRLVCLSGCASGSIKGASEPLCEKILGRAPARGLTIKQVFVPVPSSALCLSAAPQTVQESDYSVRQDGLI